MLPTTVLLSGIDESTVTHIPTPVLRVILRERGYRLGVGATSKLTPEGCELVRAELRHRARVDAIKARLPGQRITLAGVETAHRVRGYFHDAAAWNLLRVCSALAKLGPATKRHAEAECNGYPANQERYWATVDQRLDREIRALAECFPLRRGGKLEIRRQGDPRGLTLKIVITVDGSEREIGVVGS